ncbi:MAG TPA: sugar transferase [Candidatus Acidoferrales bacterium]|nr:sugar transferase [Candidatus Acidoferrales bacterium]
MTKRVFDLFFAVIGIVALAPLFILIALSIKLDSPCNPVLYHSQRVGRWGRLFWFLKFRTMVVNADKMGGASTADDDPRITRIGRFLRKHKLDELPQLFNVLRGEMSLVGPRPEVPQYVALFTDREIAILSVLPGITDWATLWDFDEGAALAGSLDPERTYLEKIRPRKLALQLEYVRRQSFRTDLAILIRMFTVLVLRSKQSELDSAGKEVSALGNEAE